MMGQINKKQGISDTYLALFFFNFVKQALLRNVITHITTNIQKSQSQILRFHKRQNLQQTRSKSNSTYYPAEGSYHGTTSTEKTSKAKAIQQNASDS